MPDGTERARLLGKTMVFKAREIAGSRPLACADPHCKVSDLTADMIFQGAFGEMQSNNKSTARKKSLRQ